MDIKHLKYVAGNVGYTYDQQLYAQIAIELIRIRKVLERMERKYGIETRTSTVLQGTKHKL